MGITLWDILMYLYITRRTNLNVSYQERGDMVYYNGRLVPLGGLMEQFEVNEHGIFFRKGRVIVPAGCGHVIKTIDDVSGFCGVCKRVICAKEGCLTTSDESGITVCRKDRVVTRDGRTVTVYESRRLLSMMKSLLNKKKEIDDDEEKGRKLLR